MVPYCYLFFLSVFILWFTYYVSDTFRMTTCLGKSCSFGLPRVPFVNCCKFSYFPFGFEGRIWDLIVSVPDHCLPSYFDEAQGYHFGGHFLSVTL